jgi:hypothetical protein
VRKLIGIFIPINYVSRLRLVAELIPYESPESTKDLISALLNKNSINLDSCNLFVNKQASELLNWDKFDVKFSCFGDFLNQLAEGIFEDCSILAFPETTKKAVLDLRTLLGRFVAFKLISKIFFRKNAIVSQIFAINLFAFARSSRHFEM